MNSKKVTEFGQIISNLDLLNYLKSSSIKGPTQVQSDCIPFLLDKGNFTVQGRTGSGKTLGYLLPLFQKLKALETKGQKIDCSHPRAVILLPTRELAFQVYAIAKEISHFAKLRVRKLVGGDKGRPLEHLLQSNIDILITTPDRCLRVFKNKELKASALKFLVLDEADQLMESSFKKTVIELVSLVKSIDMQVFLFSASRPADFPLAMQEYFPEREFQTIGQGEENILNHTVETFNLNLEDEEKFLFINNFIKGQNKKNGLIFTGNRARAKKVYELIKDSGHKNIYLLHKELEIKERVAVVEQFKKTGGALVATDIFARGIDIAHLEWVLNFDLPSEPDYYLHRSGRVGRAGRYGKVYNFVTSRDGKRHQKINESLTTQGRNDLKIPKPKVAPKATPRPKVAFKAPAKPKISARPERKGRVTSKFSSRPKKS